MFEAEEADLLDRFACAFELLEQFIDLLEILLGRRHDQMPREAVGLHADGSRLFAGDLRPLALVSGERPLQCRGQGRDVLPLDGVSADLDGHHLGGLRGVDLLDGLFDDGECIGVRVNDHRVDGRLGGDGEFSRLAAAASSAPLARDRAAVEAGEHFCDGVGLGVFEDEDANLAPAGLGGGLEVFEDFFNQREVALGRADDQDFRGGVGLDVDRDRLFELPLLRGEQPLKAAGESGHVAGGQGIGPHRYLRRDALLIQCDDERFDLLHILGGSVKDDGVGSDVGRDS